MSDPLFETGNDLWFKDAIIYEAHIKAFQDSNADGIGDFQGLIKRLDYLQDLGVTAIWLLPFYPSPQRDGGYDISDYYQINPDYGTLKQFERLLKKAHQRGLRVITELVINHTSDQHPWFQRARRSAPGSPHRDYYVWSDTPEKFQDVRIIFQDFESANWSWDPVAGAYYWHRFYAHQPDLNYDHPEVQEEVFRIIDFWIDLGVDGFRLDAVPYLFEREGTNCENLPETHAFLKKLRTHVDQKRRGILLLAEANMWPEDSAAYFGEGDECHMNFHFPIMPRMFMALKMEDRHPIIDIIDQTPDIPENCQWGLFLRNHDELTLEMVTDEERDYMYRAYNKDALSRINLGIRHRLAPLLDNHRPRIELMNALLFCLPGTPVLYYGDEIGMGDNIYLGDRDGVRTPMQWSPDRNAGFSRAKPQELYLPLINDPEYHFQTINVETQQNNPTSLLWWMKRMIAVRKRYQAFGRGNIRFFSPENGKVLVFTRSYKEEHLLVLANLSRHPQVVDLELPGFERYTPIDVFGQMPFPVIEAGPNRFTLGPYGYFWFALQPENSQWNEQNGHPELAWEPSKWMQLGKGQGVVKLEEKVLPGFLTRSGHYVLRERVLDRVRIEEAQPVHYVGGDAMLLIVRATFTEGFPEWYFVPLAFEAGNPRQHPQAPAGEYIAAVLRQEDRCGFLYEATQTQAFRHYLLERLLEGNGKAPAGFRFLRAPRAEKERPPADLPLTREVKTSGANLSLAVGERYFMKIFRWLEEAPNPDLEINSRGEASGLPVPGYLGHLAYRRKKQTSPFTLALLEPYVVNQGSAWNYFHDVARRFLEDVLTGPDISVPTTTLPGRETGEAGSPERALIGELVLDQAALLGKTLSELHLGLLDEDNPAFQAEAFSLHYQRSLFSAWQSRVRAGFKRLEPYREQQPEVDALLGSRRVLLDRLQRIYQHKIDALKVRIHGDLHLEKVFFTGRGFYFFDFDGERLRSYSELRLKKSPVRDLASIVSSFYYAASASVWAYEPLDGKAAQSLQPWAEFWFDAMKQAFLSGYLPPARERGLVPHRELDWQILWDTFFLERQLYELQFELDAGRDWWSIPLRGLLRQLDQG